jgi:hypothetical protein
MHQPSIPQNSEDRPDFSNKCDGITTSVLNTAGTGIIIGTLAALTISAYYGEMERKEIPS